MFYVFEVSAFTCSDTRQTWSLLKSREVSRVGKLAKAHISQRATLMNRREANMYGTLWRSIYSFDNEASFVHLGGEKTKAQKSGLLEYRGVS